LNSAYTKVGIATGDHKDADTNVAVVELATDYTENTLA
jgi:hypothetical protein